MAFRPETPQPVDEEDEMAMDDTEHKEFEALIASMEQQPQRLPSPALSDEEDYDAFFAELISQEQQQQPQRQQQQQPQSTDFDDAEMQM